MSFCSDLKDELSAIRPNKCCETACCYGFMLFGRSFSYKEVSLITENKNLCNLYCKYLKSNFAVIPKVHTGGNVKKNYRISVKDLESCSRILKAFGYNENDTLSVNRDIFKKKCCFGAFIRGAFLACGQMNNPEKNYRAEFVIRDIVLALDFYNILLKRGLSPKRSMRKMSTVIYFNNSETVEELLAVMGATAKTFEYMDVRTTKDFRTTINRKSNFEIKNMQKAVNASVSQQKAIELLENSGKLYTLPAELVSVAMLRKNYPDASLSELCKLLDTPITRSGLNHRLTKLIVAAKDIKTED